ncbi:unnamed protein product [Adineta ricciae]|uniref:Poly [ADP-ribose] polymerase n=1 Tax=Adineta ricciae TaxID=249248 RepID=A0A813ZFE5_ADIRI|nr:unnamed protein product [Adineta ricciae]CAF1196848.1 unnamed protein product [Adineta ricciae]
MEHENSNRSPNDFKETICPIEHDELIRQNQSALEEYFKFCTSQLVLPIFNFNKKQLHLYGTATTNFEAEKRFLDLQNNLVLKNSPQSIRDRVCWWYEAWDGTWQLYSPRMNTEIEERHQLDSSNFTMLNEIGEKITIDLTKSIEIYGTRIKRMLRSEYDKRLPMYWKLTPLEVERTLLDEKLNEYLAIKHQFDETMHNRYTTIVSIERIQNFSLFTRFCILHDNYIRRYGKENNGTMRYLYHGCPESAAKRIIERGFNRSYSGTNGTVPDYLFAYFLLLNFAPVVFRVCSWARCVFLIKGELLRSDEACVRICFFSSLINTFTVLLGGNPRICEPDDGYDTTTDGDHIFVCYHDNQCYPEYLLVYV